MGSKRGKQEKFFEEQIEDAELRIKITKVEEDLANNIMFYWEGTEFQKLWKGEAGVTMVPIGDEPDDLHANTS